MIDYDKLKDEALASPKKRSRIILEPGFDMIICLHRTSYVQMHRHPRYEAYHVIEGELVVTYQQRLEVLRAAVNPIASIAPLTWHEPRALTEFVFYREFYCGPFDKARDVEYAPWTQKEAA